MWRISNHILDRGSTGSALCWFAQHKKLCWVWSWGPFHDQWNSIKQAAKRCRGGEIWRAIVRFSSVANINHGPFRSGCWGKGKQTALRNYMTKNTVHSERFRAAAQQQAALKGAPITNDDEYDSWWTFLNSLPSCHAAGPICKFARWPPISPYTCK